MRTTRIYSFLSCFLAVFGSLAALSVLSGCSQEVSDAPGESIVNTFTFPYEITSVDSAGDTLLLGTTSNHFITFVPSTGESHAVELPDQLTNVKTYYVRRLPDGAVVVSKRNHGISYVPQGSLSGETVRLLPQVADEQPQKGSQYSSYVVDVVGDKVLFGTTNGLLGATLDELRDTATHSLRFVESVQWRRNGVNEFPIRKLGLRGDTVLVYSGSCLAKLDGRTLEEVGTDTVDVFKEDMLLHDFSHLGGDGITDKIYSNLKIDGGNVHSVVETGGLVYYVSKGKLNSVNANALSMHDANPIHHKLLFMACGDDKLYFANNTGLYQMLDSSVLFQHDTDISDKVNGAVSVGDYIYYINDHQVMRLSPKWRYNPADIRPQEVYSPEMDADDKFTCIGADGRKLFIGSRVAFYSYDLDRKEGVRYNCEFDNYKNPYFTCISYPYVGTLNDGVYRIDEPADSVNRFIPVSDRLTEITRIVHDDSLLVCHTNSGVVCCDPLERRELPRRLFADTRTGYTVRDIELSGDRIYVLTSDSLYTFGHDLMAGSSATPNPYYDGLATLADSVVAYSDLSLAGMVAADGTVKDLAPWRYDAVNWSVVTLILSVLVLLLTALVIGWLYVLAVRKLRAKIAEKKIVEAELADMRRDITYYANKRLIMDVVSTDAYTNLEKSPCPEGRHGELRRRFIAVVRKAYDSREGDRRQFKRNLWEVVDFSKRILDGAAAFVTDLATAREKLPHLVGTKAADQQPYIQIMDRLADISAGFPPKDTYRIREDIITHAIPLITAYESMYAAIDNAFDIGYLDRAFAGVSTLEGNPAEVADRLRVFDGVVMNYRTRLSAFHTGSRKALLFKNLDTADSSLKNEFSIQAMVLLMLSGADRADIERYLRWRYMDTHVPLEGKSWREKNEDKAERDKRADWWSNIFEYSTDKNMIINALLKYGLSDEQVRRGDWVPARLFDVVNVAVVRYSDLFPDYIERYRDNNIDYKS